MKKLKGVEGRLDKAWSLLVKLRAGNKCEVEYKGKCSEVLHSHHIYARNKRSTRWHPNNGVCLCVSHHVFSSKFSAHLTPTEFTEWLFENKGERFMVNLRLRAHTTSKLHKFEKELLLNELNKEIESYG